MWTPPNQLGTRTRSSTRSTCGSRRTASPPRRCCRSPRAASRPCRSTPPARPTAAGAVRTLPPSTIYGFNGQFPGPMINAEYGRPALVRFRNFLDENPDNLDRQDFGSPDHSFLTHLHNGHTAPESDGNPHYSMRHGRGKGYAPGQWVRQPLPELAGRRRLPREAELLLVPRPPDGPHRLQRLQGHGRPLPDLRPRERDGHGGRDPGAPPPGRAHEPFRRGVRRRVRHPAGVLRLPARRRGHAAPGHARPEQRVPRHREPRASTRSGGARPSSSTSRTTASSATSSPSTAPPTRRWR